MEKNASRLWDRHWDKTTLEERYFDLVRAENSIKWQRIEKIVLKEFGSFKGLKVIEIGAGVGTMAALMAKCGADVTMLDYSKSALEKSSAFFGKLGLTAEYIEQDALMLSPEVLGKYDISMSYGLTEHFSGGDRVKINKVHFDVLKPGGMAIISVPNRYNPPYRIYKYLAEITGRWQVGEEYPYSRREFRDICREIGVAEYSFLGDSLFWSFNFISKILRHVFNIKKGVDVSRIKRERGTVLDQYLSYSLILCGKK
jgi:2-polyprenyl-3-methyl-5-hydroxy-6-metoxy-1,4-benzoquinol methylase